MITTVLELTLSAIGILVTIFVAYAMMKQGDRLAAVEAHTSKLNRAEDQRREDLTASDDLRRKELAALETKNMEEVRGLRTQLHDTTTKLVDDRFRAITHSVNNHAQVFTSQLDKMTLHIAERDKALTEMLAKNPHTELQLVKALNELKDEVRDSTCTKSDFDNLRNEHSEMKTRLDRIPMLEDLRKLLKEVGHG